jgi:hypothetical protein
MINIISTFYISKYSSELDNLRTNELEIAFLNNLSCNFIEKIHLFVDDNDSLDRLKELSNKSDKVVIIEVGKQPKYTDFFRYIIDNLKNKLCMLTNSDIYLLECEENLINRLKEEKFVYALTRYEYDMSKPLIDYYCGSHDCYIFNSKFINEYIISDNFDNIDFFQYNPGIETRILKTFYDEGFKLLNPCKQIKIVHLHKTQLRNEREWVGLHKPFDWEHHCNSSWWVPPTYL